LFEPTLVEAAAYVMNIDNGLLVPDLLTMLINSIKEGVAEASYCGELVAHFLLLLAYDYACSQFTIYSNCIFSISWLLFTRHHCATILAGLLDYYYETFNLIATDIFTNKPNALVPLGEGYIL